MPMDTDETFVSINLDSNECELCHVDTGDALTKCTYCLSQVVDPCVREGFNKILHVNTYGHAECFTKCHQAIHQRSKSTTILPGGSVDVTDHIKDVINGKIQWLINYAKNSQLDDDRPLKQHLQIDCNELHVHSTPCTRTTSPNLSPGSTPSGSPKFTGHLNCEDQLSNGNETEIKSDSDWEALQNSYAKYLFGGNVPKEWKDSKVKKADKLKKCKSVGDLQRHDCQNKSALVTEKGVFTDKQMITIKSNSSIKRRPGGREKKRTVQLTRLNKECDNKTMLDRDNGRGTPKRTLKTRELFKCKENNNLLAEESVDDPCVPRHQGLTKPQMEEISVEKLREIVKTLSDAVEGASSKLVTILQERDSLQHEVGVRHATIAKLVKMKQQTLQEKCVLKT